LRGQFQFQFRGQPNDVYLIQASTDLAEWTTLATNEASSEGTVTFTDAQARNFAQRFYRGVRLSVSAAGLRNNRILVKPKLGIDLSLLHQTLGVQVFDPTGRMCGVITRPQLDKPLTSCALSGGWVRFSRWAARP